MLLPPSEERCRIPPSEHCRLHGGAVFCIAEIGMYQCSEAEHRAQMQADEDRFVAGAKPSAEVTRWSRGYFAEHEWRPWLYNQVVGWLRLYAYPRAKYSPAFITGEYFGVDAKRLTHSMKRKRFLWGAEILAVKLEDDEQIARAFVHVSDEIRKWSRSNRIRTLTLDLTVWERVGPHIRWAEILS